MRKSKQIKFARKALTLCLTITLIFACTLQNAACSLFHTQTPRHKVTKSYNCTAAPAFVDSIGTVFFSALAISAYLYDDGCDDDYDGGIYNCFSIGPSSTVLGTIFLMPALLYAASTTVGIVNTSKCIDEYENPPETAFDMNLIEL